MLFGLWPPDGGGSPGGGGLPPVGVSPPRPVRWTVTGAGRCSAGRGADARGGAGGAGSRDATGGVAGACCTGNATGGAGAATASCTTRPDPVPDPVPVPVPDSAGPVSGIRAGGPLAGRTAAPGTRACACERWTTGNASATPLNLVPSVLRCTGAISAAFAPALGAWTGSDGAETAPSAYARVATGAGEARGAGAVGTGEHPGAGVAPVGDADADADSEATAALWLVTERCTALPPTAPAVVTRRSGTAFVPLAAAGVSGTARAGARGVRRRESRRPRTHQEHREHGHPVAPLRNLSPVPTAQRLPDPPAREPRARRRAPSLARANRPLRTYHWRHRERRTNAAQAAQPRPVRPSRTRQPPTWAAPNPPAELAEPDVSAGPAAHPPTARCRPTTAAPVAGQRRRPRKRPRRRHAAGSPVRDPQDRPAYRSPRNHRPASAVPAAYPGPLAQRPCSHSMLTAAQTVLRPPDPTRTRQPRPTVPSPPAERSEARERYQDHLRNPPPTWWRQEASAQQGHPDRPVDRSRDCLTNRASRSRRPWTTAVSMELRRRDRRRDPESRPLAFGQPPWRSRAAAPEGHPSGRSTVHRQRSARMRHRPPTTAEAAEGPRPYSRPSPAARPGRKPNLASAPRRSRDRHRCPGRTPSAGRQRHRRWR